jgi:ParB-like chromosome segregation protein Spo0J
VADLPDNQQHGAIDKLAGELARAIASLPLAERPAALNRARLALHAVSPFRAEPVDCVLWVPAGTVRANDYNPNTVAPPEMRLLAHSIQADGYTQPIVSYPEDGADVVVDGFHRHRVGKEDPDVRERVLGHLPVTRIRADREGRADRIGSTIRHNRARGEHQVEGMSEIVRMLHLSGWKDEKIQAELGMEADEVLRLKQITGLAAMFAEREFSEAWRPEKK